MTLSQFCWVDTVSCMKRATDRDQMNQGRFQEAIGNVVAFAQIFAMMPLVGVTKSSASELHFKWRSARAIYATITFILAVGYLSIIFILTLSRQMTFNSIGESFKQYVCFIAVKYWRIVQFSVVLAFFSTTTITILNFIILARKWPALMRKWEFVESVLPRFKDKRENRRLAVKVRNIACVVLIVCASKLSREIFLF